MTDCACRKVLRASPHGAKAVGLTAPWAVVHFDAVGAGSLGFASAHQIESALGPAWSLPFPGLLVSTALIPPCARRFWHDQLGQVAAAWSILFLAPSRSASVKGIAASDGVRIPSYLGYMGWSCRISRSILVPMLIVWSWLYFSIISFSRGCNVDIHQTTCARDACRVSAPPGTAGRVFRG